MQHSGAWVRILLSVVLAGCGRSTALAVAAEASASGGAARAANNPISDHVLYDLEALPSIIWLDANELYWTQGGASLDIMKAPSDGTGKPEQIGSWSAEDLLPKLLAFDSDYVYWRFKSLIKRRSKFDGNVTDLDLGGGHWHGGMESDAEHLYVADINCTAIGFVNKASFTLEQFVPIPNGGKNPGTSTTIAVDDNTVYCGHAGFVHAVTKAAPHAVMDLISDQSRVAALVVNKADIYWINNRPNLGTKQESLAAFSTSGGERELGVLGFNAASMVSDTSHATLDVVGGHCVIRRYSLTDTHFLDDFDASAGRKGEDCFSLVGDSTYFYWTLESLRPTVTGAIMRAPKP